MNEPLDQQVQEVLDHFSQSQNQAAYVVEAQKEVVQMNSNELTFFAKVTGHQESVEIPMAVIEEVDVEEEKVERFVPQLEYGKDRDKLTDEPVPLVNEKGKYVHATDAEGNTLGEMVTETIQKPVLQESEEPPVIIQRKKIFPMTAGLRNHVMAIDPDNSLKQLWKCVAPPAIKAEFEELDGVEILGDVQAEGMLQQYKGEQWRLQHFANVKP